MTMRSLRLLYKPALETPPKGSQNQPQGPGGCAVRGHVRLGPRFHAVGSLSLVPSVGSSSRGRFVPATHFGGDEAATLGLTKVLSDEADEGGRARGGANNGRAVARRCRWRTIRVRHGFLWGRIPAQEGSSGGGFLRKRTIGTYPYSVEQNTHREEQMAL